MNPQVLSSPLGPTLGPNINKRYKSTPPYTSLGAKRVKGRKQTGEAAATKARKAMRGTSTAARALLKLCSRHSNLPRRIPTNPDTSLLGLSRFLSSTGIAHITIETTTRLNNVDKQPNPRSDMVLPQKPISYKEMNEAKLVSFRHLGVGQRLSEAVKELGILFPAEIHCAGIPPILKGKSLVLTSHNESVGSFTLGVLTYLLPLIQCLRRDAKLSSEEPKVPRAIVLCATKELAEKLLTVVKFLLKPVKLKTTVEDGQLESNVQEDALDASVGLLVTTPGEVLQKIEEGSVVPNEIRYLVFDEMDDIFNHGLGPEIQKFLSPLKEHASNSNDQSVQTILVTSMITKVLREDLSSLVEHLESSHAEVAAITVEIDQTEAFHLLESPEALKKKAEEVVHSLQPSS